MSKIQDLRDQLARIDWNQGGALDRFHALQREIGIELAAQADQSPKAAKETTA